MEIYKNLSLEDLPNEEWRDVVGYEGLYQVSNLGRVKSLERKSATYNYRGTMAAYTINARVLKQYIIMGYLMVGLSKDNIRKFQKVHRLVAMAFIPNPNKLPQVNHKDEDKLFNVVRNLEWCSAKYNNNFGTRNKRISLTQRNNPEYSKKIMQFTLDGTFVKEWESICEAGRAGYHRKTISNVCNKKKGYHTAQGYLWKFSNDNDEVKPYVNPVLKPILCYKDGVLVNEYTSIKKSL